MRRLVLLAAILLLLAGIAVLLYYPFLAWQDASIREQEMARFEAEIAQAQAELSSPTASVAGEDLPFEGTNPSEPESQRPFAQLYADMEAYNQSIYENGQSGLVDAWSYEQPIFTLADYGLETEIAGYLDIPAMEQRLPIYLGASMENLAKGVAVLGQTSMPIGGENTNCVIAGHRGNGSDDLFRNIQLLQPGDQVSLTNLWQTLQYTVAEIHIIQPDDLDAIRLQEGQELLTLISCHPQVGATHRYVVILTRNPEADTPQTPDDAPAVELPIVVKTTPQSPAASSECTDDAALTQAEQRNDTVVWLEKWLPLAAIPLILLCLYLLIRPRKGYRGSR